MHQAVNALIFTFTVFFVGCTILPSGPSMLVLPGTGKAFEQFRAEDAQCRYYALSQVGGITPGAAAASSGVGSAVTGTAVGAAAGAAFGGGQGAAIGAGTGMLAGSVVGSGTAAASGWEAQQRYDMSYMQCMYANGNRIPVNGQFIDRFLPSGFGRLDSIPIPPAPNVAPR